MKYFSTIAIFFTKNTHICAGWYKLNNYKLSYFFNSIYIF